MGDYLMSLIKANNITNTTGGIPTVKSQQLIPTAWVNFNGQGTIAIRDSEGVSSLTDDGVGDMVINFSTNMANTNFVTVGSASNGGLSNTDNMFGSYEWAVGYVKVGISNNEGTMVDRSFINAIVMGGQS